MVTRKGAINIVASQPFVANENVITFGVSYSALFTMGGVGNDAGRHAF